jgi:hypothetical protein
MFIPVPPILAELALWPDMVGLATGLAAPSLSKGSVNLDATLQSPLDPADSPESFCNG